MPNGYAPKNVDAQPAAKDVVAQPHRVDKRCQRCRLRFCRHATRTTTRQRY